MARSSSSEETLGCINSKGSFNVLLTIPNKPDPTIEGERGVTVGFSKSPLILTGTLIKVPAKMRFTRGIFETIASTLLRGETTTLTVAGLAPATFSVTGLTVSPSEVETGDSATVTATVENTGDLSGAYTAELKVDGTVEDTDDVTVAAGESETVTFTVSKDEAGTYTIDVGGETDTLTVTSPPTQNWLYIGVAAVAIILVAAYFFMKRS